MSEARNASVIAESRRQIERLSRLGWYHSIELPDGSVIEGHQSLEQLRRRLARFPIPSDLTGKRVLDIGAWDGWFSFEMERRGAEVLALDSTRNTRLLEARRLLNSRIDYRIGDICRTTAREIGTFDIVLFLGVLYHVKHPLLALENVCGMTRDMACIESFVTDPDPNGIPQMEFYETTELRGQLDNWVGPNAACLLAFCRTAGFARVRYEGALGERGHVTGWRAWSQHEATEPAPTLLCIENSATHDHNFSATADDYLTIYFSSPHEILDCDNVFPNVGAFGSRPIHVAGSSAGWQATCKIPPGLGPGWHNVTLSVAGTARTAPLRIALDLPGNLRKQSISPTDSSIRLTRVADGKTFDPNRVRAGENSAISVWAAGLPHGISDNEVRIRLDGTDLPAIWIAPAGSGERQINALLPSGIEAGRAVVTLAVSNTETNAVPIEIHRT